MRILLDLFFAARPLLQLPIWTVYLISLHYHNQRTGDSFEVKDLLVMFGISFLFTGAAYLNQVYDLESDRINQKVGFLHKGILKPPQLTTGFAIVSIVPMAAAPFGSLVLLIIFAQFLLLAYVYSVPPLRLKDRPIGGLLANAYGHGLLVAVAVASDYALLDIGKLRWDIPVYFSLTVGATYILTTIPDRVGDAATGKRTLGVVLGPVLTQVVAAVFFLLSVGVAYSNGYGILVYLSIMALFLVLAALFLRTDGSIRFASKIPLLLLTLVAGHFYPVYFGFVVALLIATRAYYHKRFGIVYPELT